MRLRKVTLSAMLALLACLALWVVLQAEWECAVPEHADDRRDNVTTRPEEWIRAVAENGSGQIRSRIAGPDREEAKEYRTLGRLTPGGRDALLSTLAEEILEIESKLAERMLEIEQGSDPVGLERYSYDLKLVSRLELLRARKELVEAGSYITIPLSGNTPGSIPRAPRNVITATYGAYAVEGDELAQVLIWVDREQRESLRAIAASRSEVFAARRDEWIERFNSSPSSERQKWFERHAYLSSMHEQGVEAMSSEELAEWIALSTEIRHLRLQLLPERLVVF